MYSRIEPRHKIRFCIPRQKVIVPQKKVRMFPGLASCPVSRIVETRFLSAANIPVSATEQGYLDSTPQVAFQASHLKINLKSCLVNV